MPTLRDRYRYARARATAMLREATSATPTLALDLDDTALHFQRVLVPLASGLREQGWRIGVITGNRTDTARELFITLYGEPAFYLVHEPDTDDHIAHWKAQQCQRERVTLLIDDFKHGELTRKFMKHLTADTLPLQVILPQGAPLQRVGQESAEAEEIDRTVAKYRVAACCVPALAGIMLEHLDADEYDPTFRGQVIESTYFDTPTAALLNAKQAHVSYVVLRLRSYPDGSHFLEAKSGSAKYRAPLTEDQAAGLTGGIDPLPLVAELLPDVAEQLATLVTGQALAPCSTVTYRRYARETGGTRMTLDTVIRTAGGKAYPDAVLEIKREGPGPQVPDLSGLMVTPIDLSKFVWSVEPAQESLTESEDTEADLMRDGRQTIKTAFDQLMAALEPAR